MTVRSRSRGRWHALPEPLHGINEGLAFVLELLMMAGLAWCGASTGSGLAVCIALTIGAPALAALIWGLLAAPRALIRLPVAGVLAVKTVVFGGTAAAVYNLGQHALAITFAAVAMANMAIATIDRATRAETWLKRP
jgi:hypothetical protein